MISNLAFCLGVAVLIIPLVEVFLGDAERRRIETASMRAWNWLDERKRRPLSDLLKQRDVWRLSSGFLFGVVLLASVINAAVHDSRPDQINWLGPSGVAAAALLLLIFYSASRMVADAVGWMISNLAPGRVSWLFWLVPFLAVALFGLATLLIVGGVHFFPAMVVGGVLVLAAFCIGSLWIVAAVPLVAIHAASITIGAAEFVLRRLNEYTKGPLVATAMILAAAGGLLKVLGY